jgi:hypothetical protein
MDSIIIKIVIISLLVGVLVFIVMGDRRIRKERELEDRQKQEKQAAGKSE